jgi:hypothetical protein
MVTAPEAHDVAVLPPWYTPSPRKVAIHRYLDAEFVSQFQADASNAPERNAALFAWEREDRMGPDQGNLLKLRRPLHRTFHVVAWEASCKIPTAPSGQPALAPEKVESAGFVLRTGNPAAPQGFQLVQGKPQGWSAVEPGVDPDAARQVKALGVLLPQQATPVPAYTGEETLPLHPLAVQDGSATHTLLFGYLPIGGGDFAPPSAATPPAPDTSSLPEDLPWPFGLADRSNGLPPVYTYDQQIAGGQVTSQLGAVLRVLLGRYQFVEPAAWSDPANIALVDILDALNFYTAPPVALSGQALRDWAATRPAQGHTLGSVLRNQIAAQNLLTELMKAAPQDKVPLPAAAGVPASAANLLVIESVAAQLRAAMRLRLARAIATSTAAIPIPKLVSGPSGRYFVVPFVRTVKPDGCPRISWGAPSEPFAVAAMFDPDAARPSLIEMPGLADAKKGLARGATFDMPPDLANLANSLANNDAVQAMWSGNGSMPSGGGTRFICSFSLPVISICAMVMLSIVLNLLNIVLGWMAWAKICLPVPSKK